MPRVYPVGYLIFIVVRDRKRHHWCGMYEFHLTEVYILIKQQSGSRMMSSSRVARVAITSPSVKSAESFYDIACKATFIGFQEHGAGCKKRRMVERGRVIDVERVRVWFFWFFGLPEALFIQACQTLMAVGGSVTVRSCSTKHRENRAIRRR